MPYHLKKGEVATSNIVIVDFDINPAGVLCGFLNGQTVAPVVYLSEKEKLLCRGVDTAVKLSSKKIHSHDAKDEPEDRSSVVFCRRPLVICTLQATTW